MDQQRAVSVPSLGFRHRVREEAVRARERETTMRKILLTTVLALGAAAVAPALADAGKSALHDRCQIAPGEVRLPAEAIRKTLEDLGYRVVRLKLDDGCYEAQAANDTGIPIE